MSSRQRCDVAGWGLAARRLGSRPGGAGDALLRTRRLHAARAEGKPPIPASAAADKGATLTPERATHLFVRYYDSVYRYVCGLTSDSDSAEDFANESFLRLFRALQSGTITPEALPGWLYRVARNLVIDDYRHRNLAADGLLPQDPLTPSPAEDVFAHQDMRIILARLTPAQQQVIYLRFVEGFEPIEIAGLMGKSAGAVKQLQYRALATLRRHLRHGGYRP